MCIEKTKPRHKKKDYIEAPQDPQVVIYYREIGKGDPNVFRVAEYEEAVVVCPRGEINHLDSPGFYRVITIPAKVMWVRISKLVFTVGVPRGVLSGGFGINVDLVLIMHNIETLLTNVIKVGHEGAITIADIRKELRRILESAAKNIEISKGKPRKELVDELHHEMNQLLIRSWLSGFVLDVQSIGFSFECELAKILEGDEQ